MSVRRTIARLLGREKESKEREEASKAVIDDAKHTREDAVETMHQIQELSKDWKPVMNVVRRAERVVRNQPSTHR